MKGVIIFGLLLVGVVGVYSDSREIQESDLRAKCAQQLGIDIRLLEARDKTLKNLQDGKLGCFFECFLKELGIMHDGVIDNTNNDKYPPFPETKECAGLRGKDECDTANKVTECIFTKQMEMGLII